MLWLLSFQYANLAFEKLTGYARKDVIGRTTRLGPYPSNCKDSGSVSVIVCVVWVKIKLRWSIV